MPRPTRRLECLAPSAGWMLFNSMICSVRKPPAYDTTFTRYDTLLIMPRTAGVSSNSETELMPRRPRPRTVARCVSRVPIKPMTNLTLTVFAAVFAIRITLAQNFFNGFTTLGGDFGRRVHLGQAIQCCTHHIVWIGRTVRFGDDVCDTHHFENRAHRAAGNHA